MNDLEGAVPGPYAAEARAAGDHEDPSPYAFPWPPTGDESAPEALVRTWRSAVLEPRRFFAAMPATADLGPPLLFYLLLALATTGIGLLWEALGLTLGLEMAMLEALAPGTSSPEATRVTLGDVLLMPLMLLLSLFFASAVSHLVLRVVGGATGSYGLTVRVFCFAQSPRLLIVVPLLGGYLGFAWMLVVAVVGLQEAHRTDAWRAVAAVLVPLIFATLTLGFAALLLALTTG